MILEVVYDLLSDVLECSIKKLSSSVVISKKTCVKWCKIAVVEMFTSIVDYEW